VSRITLSDLLESESAVLSRLGREIASEGDGRHPARHMNSLHSKGGSHSMTTHGNRGAMVERAVPDPVGEDAAESSKP
jgi:hypothetical protein